jgi:hypothetical protein
VQADPNKTTDTNTTRMTWCAQLGMLFQVRHMPISSGCPLHPPLIGVATFTSEKPAPSRFIPPSAICHGP